MRALAIIQEHQAVINQLSDLLPEISQFSGLCRQALSRGRTIFFCGNGGSAADCQHLAAELVGRFQKERRGLPGIALTTDTSILTAVGNDYGFDQVFARQIEALAREGDVVVGLSTSGNSPNVVKAITAARGLGAVTVGMTGETGGQLDTSCDVCLKVPSSVTARIQEAHILIGHILCELIDEVDYDV
ncbi:MAG: D-sedoheptulose 7-phosphate isomerase [Sporomusaceae bacterium]|nr:D-sedoheptulose 7-phosphate isomerase [Sporomusaceae bacterium]